MKPKPKPEPDNLVKASATLGMRWVKSAFEDFLTRKVEGVTIVLTQAELATLLGLAIEDGMRHVLKEKKK